MTGFFEPYCQGHSPRLQLFRKMAGASGVPQLVGSVRRLLKHLARRQHDEGRPGDQGRSSQCACRQIRITCHDAQAATDSGRPLGSAARKVHSTLRNKGALTFAVRLLSLATVYQ